MIHLPIIFLVILLFIRLYKLKCVKKEIYVYLCQMTCLSDKYIQFTAVYDNNVLTVQIRDFFLNFA